MDIFNQKLTDNNGILEPEGLMPGEYDKHVLQYDKLVSNKLYNQIVWGNTPADYKDFAKKALESTGETALDIACGPLTFTKEVYAQTTKQLILTDLSEQVLTIARERIEQINPQQKNIIYLRADALNLPITDNSINTVMNFGFLHLTDNPLPLLNEIARILKNGGKAYFTTLCSDRPIAAVTMAVLKLMGHIARPRKAAKTLKFFDSSQLKIDYYMRKGGMLYIVASRK